MANVGNKQLGEYLRHQTQETVENDRDKQATITAISNWATTGEIKCTLLNGNVIWVDAGGNLQELAVGDVIWVRQFGVGQRSQYRMVGFFRQAGGTRAPSAIRSDVLAASKVSELWASDGDPQAAQVDAAGNIGIGTMTPQAQVDIVHATSHAALKLDAATGYNPQIQLAEAGTLKWNLQMSGDNDRFRIYDHVGTAERLTILSDGSVGIGAAIPARKLDVNGSFRSVSITLPQGTAFPGSPAEGDVFYRTDEDALYVYDGAAWDNISGTTTFTGGTITADISMDDGAGDSPKILFIGGTNDDTIQLFLADDAVAGQSDIIIRLANDNGASALIIQNASGAQVAKISSLGNLQISGDLNASGNLYADFLSVIGDIELGGDTLTIETTKTPASAGATGTKGDICWDESYLYICIATNTWRRIAHATW